VTIIITAFERSPDGGKGLARDTRVRWALEEAGLPYEVRLVSFRSMKEAAHLALHPFGQIPTYEEGDLALFETGSIVLHIAERHSGLFPVDANARARAITWMFAALNTVEPPILDLVNVKLARCSAGRARRARPRPAWLALAEEHGVGTLVGSMMEGPVGVGAAASLVAACGTTAVSDLDAAWWLASSRVTGGPRYQGAAVILPSDPGLGVTGVRLN